MTRKPAKQTGAPEGAPQSQRIVARELRRLASEYEAAGEADIETVVSLLRASAHLIDAVYGEKDATTGRADAAEAFVDILLPFAETGERVRRPFSKSNEERTKQANAERAAWQAEADRLWSDPRHAGKSVANVAALVARTLGGNPDTIRRRIRKLS